MRDTVLPAASGGNEEMAASHVCAWLRKVQLSSCPGNFIFVTVIRLPIVYATLLYSSQLGTSLSVQQIALDSAFSHQEKKKFERRASLLKTAAEPNVAETALIDAFSAARGETGFTVAAGRLVSPALRHVFLFPPPPLPSVPPFILPPHLEHCCVATETRCATLCAARGGCAATWLELSLRSSLGSWRERLQCGAAVVLFPHSVAQKKKKRGKRWLRFVAGRLIFRLEALLGNVALILLRLSLVLLKKMKLGEGGGLYFCVCGTFLFFFFPPSLSLSR